MLHPSYPAELPLLGPRLVRGSASVGGVTGFELRSEVAGIEVIAVGGAICILAKLRKTYGPGRWRKLKGHALVELPDGTVARAEVHWYEAHGIGRKDMKVKRLLG